MVHYLLILLMLLNGASAYAQECKGDREIQELTSACQSAYYKYAPSCKFGDGLCLSLVLQGLVDQNLFDYRPDLRRTYNTPLKRKMYSKTEEYKKHYVSMIEDFQTAFKAEFCAETTAYWLYDVSNKGFTFPPKTLIPKGSLYRFNNLSCVGGYDYVSVKERDAVEIEGWETLAGMKIVFFKLSMQKSKYVDIDLQSMTWFIPTFTYDFEGQLQLSYEEGCPATSHYTYKVGK